MPVVVEHDEIERRDQARRGIAGDHVDLPAGKAR